MEPPGETKKGFLHVYLVRLVEYSFVGNNQSFISFSSRSEGGTSLILAMLEHFLFLLRGICRLAIILFVGHICIRSHFIEIMNTIYVRKQDRYIVDTVA